MSYVYSKQLELNLENNQTVNLSKRALDLENHLENLITLTSNSENLKPNKIEIEEESSSLKDQLFFLQHNKFVSRKLNRLPIPREASIIESRKMNCQKCSNIMKDCSCPSAEDGYSQLKREMEEKQQKDLKNKDGTKSDDKIKDNTEQFEENISKDNVLDLKITNDNNENKESPNPVTISNLQNNIELEKVKISSDPITGTPHVDVTTLDLKTGRKEEGEELELETINKEIQKIENPDSDHISVKSSSSSGQSSDTDIDFFKMAFEKTSKELKTQKKSSKKTKKTSKNNIPTKRSHASSLESVTSLHISDLSEVDNDDVSATSDEDILITNDYTVEKGKKNKDKKDQMKPIKKSLTNKILKVCMNLTKVNKKLSTDLEDMECNITDKMTSIKSDVNNFGQVLSLVHDSHEVFAENSRQMNTTLNSLTTQVEELKNKYNDITIAIKTLAEIMNNFINIDPHDEIEGSIETINESSYNESEIYHELDNVYKRMIVDKDFIAYYTSINEETKKKIDKNTIFYIYNYLFNSKHNMEEFMELLGFKPNKNQAELLESILKKPPFPSKYHKSISLFFCKLNEMLNKNHRLIYQLIKNTIKYNKKRPITNIISSQQLPQPITHEERKKEQQKKKKHISDDNEEEASTSKRDNIEKTFSFDYE